MQTPQVTRRERAEVLRDCRSRKSLHELGLPKGVRLSHPHPLQRRMHGLLAWTFAVIFEGDSRIGPVEHIERYDPRISDSIQLHWALNALQSKVNTLTGKHNEPKWIASPRVDRVHSGNFGAVVSQMQRQYSVAQ